MAGATDYRNIVHMIIHFCCNFSFAGLSNFLPTIVAGMGYSNINAQGLTAPVYFTSFLCCVGTALLSDRYGKRAVIIMVCASIGCVGYLLLAILEKEKYNNVRYFAVWLAVCGVFPALSLNITWLLNNNTSESKRGAGLAVLAIFGQCSSFLSSAVFPRADAPFFVKGCAIGSGFTGVIVILAGAMWLRLRHLNAVKDREHGPVEENVQIDITDLGEKHPMFRYLL